MLRGMPPKLDADFTQAALIERIVRGGLTGDRVRLHGAIVAALEIHGRLVADREVFAPALRVALEHSIECRDIVAGAILAYRQASRCEPQ